MKSFSPIAFALMAALGVAAADVNASECASMCLANMSKQAADLGCKTGDLACLCKSDDYKFGIRDCTKEACPSDDAEKVLAMAVAKCPGGVAGSDADDSKSSSASNSTSSGSDATTTGSDSVTSTGAAGSKTATGSGSAMMTGSATASGASGSGSSMVTKTSTSTGANTTATTTTTSAVSDSDSDSDSNGSGSKSDSDSDSDSNDSTSASGSAAPSTSEGAAVPMATVGGGAMGVLGMLAILAL